MMSDFRWNVPILEAALAEANMLLKGLVFAQQNKLKGEWYYAGDTVQPGDKDAPLCWWMPEDSDMLFQSRRSNGPVANVVDG